MWDKFPRVRVNHEPPEKTPRLGNCKEHARATQKKTHKIPIDSVPPSAENAPHDKSRQLSLSPVCVDLVHASVAVAEKGWRSQVEKNEGGNIQVGHESATRALILLPVSVRVISTYCPQWDPPA